MTKGSRSTLYDLFGVDTQKLALAAERKLLQPKGLSLESYSTRGFRCRGAKGVGKRLVLSSTHTGGPLLESASSHDRVHYEERGLVLAVLDEERQDYIGSVIARAVDGELASTPSIQEAVVSLVRAIHVIDTPDDDYDSSFSEPPLPFSIFVSVPRADPMRATWRIAESIGHEALHLQLSLLERETALVDPSASEMVRSPWKGEPRSVGGLLHAVYVFSELRRFWKSVAAQEGGARSAYAGCRVGRIEKELSLAIHLADCKGLTEAGRILARRLLSF